ncbi:hypothetical protein RWA03_22195 (plasmid) [Sinorhizobium meliloti]|nr:hypothetical protein [Sinorhizobium meliloti]TWA86037.1 hypothetical protein FB000_1625 [Ensifer sp. SEMIA 134]TWB22320.1 hypothetical protein FB001_1679 [Ensifer sp. SEMIA 135]WGI79002.1 hypothetical protein QC756_30320 [Sinorhizobium meliloti]SEJ81835.1 hypothetical protein SAMN04244575_06391 [Sinorhizobium meliloti]
MAGQLLPTNELIGSRSSVELVIAGATNQIVSVAAAEGVAKFL